MKPVHNDFKSRLLSGTTMIGTFQKTPSMMISEVLSSTELDVFCIDAEHSPFDRLSIDSCVFAYRSANKPSLVRPASASPEQILNALDCGATGILAPHIDSVEKAKSLVQNCHYGNGGRGYAGSTRAAHYTGKSIQENIDHNQKENTIIAQIEDLAALEVIDDICAVEGIDALFIGMADLAVSLGCDTLDHPQVVTAAKRVCESAKKANRRVGIFVAKTGDIPFWKQQGVTLFLLASEHVFIKQGAQNLLSGITRN